MSFPRYPKYKNSGVEWLGDVPEHWTISRLGFLASKIGSGKTPSGGADNYQENGVLFIRSQNVYDDGLRLDDVVYISKDTDREMSMSRVQPGDILLNITGASLGRTCLVPDSFARANVNQHVCVIRLKTAVLRDFVGLVLKSAAVKSQLDYTQNGAAREGLNFKMVAGIACPLPPAEERNRIATFLNRETAKIDALIAEQQRLIELLHEKRQAVISHAVTKGLNPDALMKDSGIEWLGKVPEHWQVHRIAGVFHEVSEPGQEDLPILSVSIHDGVSDKELDEEELDRKVSRSDDRSKYKRVAAGDLVYNMMRAWQGAFGTVGLDGMVSPAYVVARPRPDIVTAYVEHVLRTPQAVEQMRRYSRGITDFRLRLYWEEFRNIRIPSPPAEEAKAICRRIVELTSQWHSLAAEAEGAIALLQERRSALISAAVTGQIDVRGLTGSEAA